MTPAQFKITICNAMHGLQVRPGARIGVALSGGADSVALLFALVRIGYEVTALHCDFSLRGDESDADSRFCSRLCDSIRTPIEKVKFDTAGCRLPGESIEMTCRRLRYDWFERKAVELNLEHIALGHHIEDSVETMLINLTRGTGPKGLTGISPRRGIYIRPMLHLSRTDIEDFLRAKGLPYRTDSSNLANDYRRNIFRNLLLPRLYELIPTAQAGILQTAKAMTHTVNMISTYLKWCRKRYVHDGKIDLDAMRRDATDMGGTLYMLIPEALGCSPGMDIIEQIISEPDNRSSRLFPDGNGNRLELHRGMLQRYQERIDEEFEVTLRPNISSPVTIAVTTTDYAGFCKSPKDNDTLWLDGEIIDKPHRFVLRHWREGDRMHPFGAPGQRLISDIFSDLKMSRSDKNRAFILTVDERPLWIVGIRGSNLYKVTENSKKIIKLQYVRALFGLEP